MCAERLVVRLRNDVAFRTVIQPHYTQRIVIRKEKIMGYRVKYEWKDKIDYIHLADCENIMDAMFKFYEAHGMECEIIIIEKW